MEDMTKHCSECGAPFECVQATGCWCAELPWRLPVPAPTGDQPKDPAKDCLCPKCLPERLGIAIQRTEN